MMKYYASYGGGVSSTGMVLALIEQNDPIDEVVFVQVAPDAEYPETSEYIEIFFEYLKSQGVQCATICAEDFTNEYINLTSEMRMYSIIPNRRYRWCTQKYKIEPLHKYVEKPCGMYIGIETNESHRQKSSKTDGITNIFPLVKYHITRNICKDIIKRHGLPIPIKSRCWFCPFQTRAEWKYLFENHRDLYIKAAEMEHDMAIKRIENEKAPFFFRDKPLIEGAIEFHDEIEQSKKQQLVWR